MVEHSNFGLIKAMAWSGVLLVACLIITYALMGFLPPPSPDLPAEAIKQIFIDRKMDIRIGTALCLPANMACLACRSKARSS